MLHQLGCLSTPATKKLQTHANRRLLPSILFLRPTAEPNRAQIYHSLSGPTRLLAKRQMRPEGRLDSLFVVTCDQSQDFGFELWHLGTVQYDVGLGVCGQSPMLIDFLEPRQGSADCDRSPCTYGTPTRSQVESHRCPMRSTAQQGRNQGSALIMLLTPCRSRTGVSTLSAAVQHHHYCVAQHGVAEDHRRAGSCRSRRLRRRCCRCFPRMCVHAKNGEESH